MQALGLALAAGAALSAIMTGAWIVQRRTGNSGWIDVFWTFGTGAVACALALWPIEANDGPQTRQLLAGLFVAAWSLRLGWHILLRTRAATDDPRYRDMIGQWGADAKSKLFWHLQVQALVGLLLACCVMLAARNPAAGLRLQDGLAIALFVLGFAGEALADWQLRRFKQDPANRGGICDVGLWSWSRHPNYFFEWLCWLAYPLLAIDFVGDFLPGFFALLAPLCIYWLLMHVSGIPPLEAHMLRTRKTAFKAYRQRTSAFFPLPRRR
jgi:steroid 5-alpha reductase family enzyme